MKDKKRIRFGIRFKITMTFLVIGVFIAVTFFAADSIYKFGLFKKSIVLSYTQIAQLLASSVGRIIVEEVKDVASYTHNTTISSFIKNANEVYKDIDEPDFDYYFTGMDKEWFASPEDSPFVKRYVDNQAAVEARNIISGDPDIAEVIIADIQGGLVASTGKSTDFYQADEQWWQKAMEEDGQDVFIGDISFDKSAQVDSIVIATAIKNEENEKIGVLKVVFDSSRFFGHLVDFEIGETGHAALVETENNTLIVHKGEKIREVHTASYLLNLNFFEGGRNWKIYKDPDAYAKDLFIIAERIDDPILKDNNLNLTVYIHQNAYEVFSFLKSIIIEQSIMLVLLILIIIPTGFIIGGIFAKPILMLNKGVKKVGLGDLNYRVYIKARDEIGDLAETFNDMTQRLQQTTTSIEELNGEIEMRKRLETALRNSEVRYKAIYSSSKDAIMILAPNGNFIAGNPAAIEMFRCNSEQEFINLTPANLSPKYQPDGRPSLEKAKEMMDIAMKTGSNLFEWKHKRLTGEEFFATVLLTKMEIKEERLLQAAVRDITEQKKVERLKDEFVSTVSHELRTPLSITKEGISLVLDEITGKINQKQKKTLKMSKENIDRLARIIDDLLDISKIESGKIELKRSEIDIVDLIRNEKKKWNKEADKKKQKLDIVVSKDKVGLYADRDKLIQIFDNLISNAIKYTPEGGSINIHLKDENDKIEISVKDTGVGIAKEDLTKVFDKFQQFGRVAGPGPGGTGLGLSIVKELVQMHGGIIDVKSRVNEGSCFTFIMPKK